MKVGRILLLVVTFFVISGAQYTTEAAPRSSNATLASSCASTLVSTKLCEEIEKQACSGPAKEAEGKRQIQAAVVAAPLPTQSQSQQVTPAALPTMAPLNSTYASDSAVLDSERVFTLVNQYRASQGLAAFEKDDKACEMAQVRSTEIVAEIGNGTLHSGLYNRNLPYWIFENAKYGSNEEGTVAWWLSSPVHHQSIVGDYKYSCVKCTGSYCSQVFTNYAPK